MDSNKDEALRCVHIAEEAIASGNTERALKFIKIAQRLNHRLSVDQLLAACKNLNSRSSPVSPVDEKCVSSNENKGGSSKLDEGLDGERSYTEEHVQLIRQIKRNKDYYSILGVEKTCSVDEIRRAYKKLLLKVHPDKNKAPGSDKAFKTVCKAFKCLSDDDLRRQYDQVGLVDEFEYNQWHDVRQRRRRYGHDLFDDDFDPDEIFRSFFGQGDMFRASHVYGTRGMGGHQNAGGPNFLILLQILPFLLIFLLAFLPISEPEYSLFRNYSYQVPKETEKFGVEFYVKSSASDVNFLHGSPARANIEDNVVKDYKYMLWCYCHMECQKRHWNKNLPTPHCNKLQSLGLA
ncbi:chaperone protein dnaJ 49-like [Durio zibethinus]|uniref:Chaperone protein dnaJ 49-like n=1 Tax=Durio zibethinus TaxID=66656 RepID=A0A6P6A763_DURZI|nr:chaperone protein dnaJ 49-like [Durio zibethinus]XP_022760581.1 chaperone protein dnaJ 49-like [Durio zibethinus]